MCKLWVKNIYCFSQFWWFISACTKIFVFYDREAKKIVNRLCLERSHFYDLKFKKNNF